MPDLFLRADDNHRSYHSGASGRLVRRPEAVMLYKRALPRAFVTFETGKYRPPFTVTIRTSVDNWVQEHTGVFSNGRWEFTLQGPGFDNEFKMKLRLDGAFWMRGDDVTIHPDEPEQAARRPIATQIP